MEQSKYTAPHVTHHDDVDVTKLTKMRSQMKGEAEGRETKLSYMPFVIKAVIPALQKLPIVNSQLDEEQEEIVLKKSIIAASRRRQTTGC